MKKYFLLMCLILFGCQKEDPESRIETLLSLNSNDLQSKILYHKNIFLTCKSEYFCVKINQDTFDKISSKFTKLTINNMGSFKGHMMIEFNYQKVPAWWTPRFLKSSLYCVQNYYNHDSFDSVSDYLLYDTSQKLLFFRRRSMD